MGITFLLFKLAGRVYEFTLLRTGSRVGWAELIRLSARAAAAQGDARRLDRFARLVVEFADEDFASSVRDATYYVRAIQAATPTINGAGQAMFLNWKG